MTLALLALSALAATFYGTLLLRAPETQTRTLIKTAAVACLAAFTALRGGPPLLIVAFIFSSIGDYCLAVKSEKRFFAGLLNFMLAHIALILLFRESGMPWAALAEPWRLGLGTAMAALGFGLVIWLWHGLAALRVPVIIYVVVILAMVFSALLLPQAPTATVGAIAFALSDACLGITTFRLREGPLATLWLPRATWWLYWLAQLLIMLAFVQL